MLVDEVLAVGDAAFAQKCMDVFQRRRRAGRTLVLVTHDMATVESLCDRAMLIDDGELRLPRRSRGGGAALLPGQLRAATPARQPTRRGGGLGRQRRARRRLARGRGGERVTTVEQGEPLALQIVLEARRDLEAPGLRHPRRQRAGHARVRLQPRRRRSRGRAGRDRRRASACALAGEIENRLAPGPLLRALLRRPAAASRGTSRCTSCGCSTSSSTAPRTREGERDASTPTWRRRSSHE